MSRLEKLKEIKESLKKPDKFTDRSNKFGTLCDDTADALMKLRYGFRHALVDIQKVSKDGVVEKVDLKKVSKVLSSFGDLEDTLHRIARSY